MISVKELLGEKKVNPTHVMAISEPPTTTSVANFHHVLSQTGDKDIAFTQDVSDESKSAFKNSGNNHKHFIRTEPIKTIYDMLGSHKTPVILHVHPNQMENVKKSVASTHPQLNVTVQSLPHNKGESKTPHPSIKKADVKSIFKEEFSVGDFVTNGDIEGEILNVHTKYATVVSEGKEYRFWIKDLIHSINEPKRDQLYKEAFIFKGYKTKNFNRQLAENFKEIAKESTDDYAVLACLKSFDYVLGVNDKTISENFGATRIQVDRLRRYASKIQCPYLVEKIISVVEEELLKFAILEGIRYTTTDRNMIAKVIANTAEINISGVDPTNIINQAVIKLKTQPLTAPGWKLLGRLLNTATRAGIRWNRDTFSNSQQTMMELV